FGHAAHLAALAPAWHFWIVWPPTVPVTHVPLATQGLAEVQLALVWQSNWQVAEQPCPVPFWAPRSHCSPASTTPLPHTAAGVLHTPLLHTLPPPQEVPSASGVPAAHFWPGVPVGPVTVLQVSAPLHGLPSSQVLGAFVHEKVQLGSQPEPA